MSLIPDEDEGKRDLNGGMLPSSTVNTDTKYWFNNSAFSTSENKMAPL